MNEINYSEKINNFKAITENYDEENAIRYLEQNGWDEIVLY